MLNSCVYVTEVYHDAKCSVKRLRLVSKEVRYTMARRCEVCGRGPTVGNRVVRRGRPKREGGIGLNVTGVSKRRFLPNVQKVRVVNNGTVRRIKVCTRCLKKGKVVKAS